MLAFVKIILKRKYDVLMQGLSLVVKKIIKETFLRYRDILFLNNSY